MDGSLYSTGGKRALDVIVSTGLLVVAIPILIVGAAAVLISVGRPVIFTQERLGKECKVFSVLKLRTMRDARDSGGRPLPDSERLTRVGKILRRTSIDELPQLLNVLRAEMSLVGPRPLYVSYAPYYSERELLRHSVRPGITGLAQVSGRNQLRWDDRLELDVQYVEGQSFALDMKIVARTIANVVAGAGIGEQVLPDLSDERRWRAGGDS